MSFWKTVKLRKIEVWPGRLTPPTQKKRSPYTSTLTSTLALLKSELGFLGAASVVIQVAIRDYNDLRQDGGLKANAQLIHSGVILSCRTIEGEYFQKAFDMFTNWTHNLHALAQNLNHLRLAGLHGAEPRREQYAGWIFRAQPNQDPPRQKEHRREEQKPEPPPAASAPALDVSAAAFLAKWSGREARGILEEAAYFLRALREAQAATHPDRAIGAEKALFHDRFLEVKRAGEVLKRRHMP